MTIKIVFDNPPSPGGARFVEVEDADGKSIDPGEWVKRPDGMVELVLTTGFDPVEDIKEFHHKFDLAYEGTPRMMPPELSKFRIEFMMEELIEYRKAVEGAQNELSRAPEYRDPAEYAHHLEQQLDALVDLVYVALGTSYLKGFNFREAWRRVHAANMKKVRAINAEESKRGSEYDVVKPKDWEPPSHIDLVEVNDLMSNVGKP